MTAGIEKSSSNAFNVTGQPFGRYKGMRLADVPASQLDRWRDANWIDDLFPNVRDYINRAGAPIDQELDEAEPDWMR